MIGGDYGTRLGSGHRARVTDSPRMHVIVLWAAVSQHEMKRGRKSEVERD